MLNLKTAELDDILIVNKSGNFDGILFEIGDNVLFKGIGTYRGRFEFYIKCLEKKRNKFLWTWGISQDYAKYFTKIGTLN